MNAKISTEALAELIAPLLAGTYHCTRVWEAWQVGTMSVDDFAPVEESDTPHEIAAAILAALPMLVSPQPASSAGGQEPRARLDACSRRCRRERFWRVRRRAVEDTSSGRRPVADEAARADALAASAGHFNFNSMRQCADAWLAVACALLRYYPEWSGMEGSGKDSAVAAIKALSERGAPVVGEAAQPQAAKQKVAGGAITQAMVDAACEVTYVNYKLGRKAYRAECESEMRRALAVAFAAQEVPYNAAGIDLTACQLHEALLMAGDPDFEADFEDRGRVRIFYTETGHSGPGLYCECVDVEEEGCILLDGTSPAIRQQPAPAAVPPAYPAGSDRDVLRYLMQQFDAESWQCPSCGHAEDTATMDSADYLRQYLAAHPDPVAPAAVQVEGIAELLEDSERAAELARRLVAAGPKAAHVSASETHEISDFVLAAVKLLPALASHPQSAAPQGVDLGQPNAPGRTLYVDLDGVMADFDGAFPAVFGLDHRSLADEEMWRHINSHQSFFRDLPPMAGALDFFRSIEHLNPVILTACPKSNYAHVAAQKRAWVREHLSATCLVLPVLGGRHKPLFMHQAGDVLIDDFGRNCDAWVEAGGIAIKHEGDWAATRAALDLIDSQHQQQESGK